jgi:hypothetical protein
MGKPKNIKHRENAELSLRHHNSPHHNQPTGKSKSTHRKNISSFHFFPDNQTAQRNENRMNNQKHYQTKIIENLLNN